MPRHHFGHYTFLIIHRHFHLSFHQHHIVHRNPSPSSNPQSPFLVQPEHPPEVMPFFEGASNFTISDADADIEYNFVDGSQFNIFDAPTGTRTTYTTLPQSSDPSLDHAPHAFFRNATNFSVRGGVFNEVQGDQTNVTNRTMTGRSSATRHDYRAVGSMHAHVTETRMTRGTHGNQYPDGSSHSSANSASSRDILHSATRPTRTLIVSSLGLQRFGRDTSLDNPSRNTSVSAKHPSSAKGGLSPPSSSIEMLSDASSSMMFRVRAAADARVDSPSHSFEARTATTISTLNLANDIDNAAPRSSGPSGSAVSGEAVNIAVDEVVSSSAGDSAFGERERAADDIQLHPGLDEIEKPAHPEAHLPCVSSNSASPSVACNSAPKVVAYADHNTWISRVGRWILYLLSYLY